MLFTKIKKIDVALNAIHRLNFYNPFQYPVLSEPIRSIRPFSFKDANTRFTVLSAFPVFCINSDTVIFALAESNSKMLFSVLFMVLLVSGKAFLLNDPISLIASLIVLSKQPPLLLSLPFPFLRDIRSPLPTITRNILIPSFAFLFIYRIGFSC